ncbi:MAG: hypothetical protein ABFR32_12180 [Bacteroidota bacterium]
MGCNNDDDTTLNSRLVGKWKWIESSGGIMGVTYNPENTGKEITIEFTSNTKKSYINGVLEYQTTYYLEKGESIFSTEKVDLINFENGFKQSIEINNNNLILSDEVYDGFWHEYKRE